MIRVLRTGGLIVALLALAACDPLCSPTSESAGSNGKVTDVDVTNWLVCTGNASSGGAAATGGGVGKQALSWTTGSATYTDPGGTTYSGNAGPATSGKGVSFSGTLTSSAGKKVHLAGVIDPCPRVTSTSQSVGATLDHFHHGSSSTLWLCVTSTPPEAGAPFFGTITKPGGTSVAVNGTLDANGKGAGSTEINQFGRYTGKVVVNGLTVTATDDVGAATGKNGC